MNLAEFPLAPIADRFLDGRKTVIISDQVWDRNERRYLPRTLTISGSDRYGLPTAMDDDVLLALIQLSSFGDFQERKLPFSRYEIIKLLRRPDETANYKRVTKSLRRWLGVSIYSERAFYDSSRESWVSRDFGILDNLYIYEREQRHSDGDAATSWLTWNEVMFNSFQAGYVKKLDWDLYCRLKSPVAKRLYRFLDKRFYHTDQFSIPLDELAFGKVRISSNGNRAQVKRTLMKGIRELEQLWDLRVMAPEKRFRKDSGTINAVFVRRTRKRRQETNQANAESKLSYELTLRDVGPGLAEELSRDSDTANIQTMIELYDWYQQIGKPREAGFLVYSIRNPEQVRMPRGFQSSVERGARQEAEQRRKRREKRLSEVKEAKRTADETARLQPFVDFWKSLSTEQQVSFEQEAIDAAHQTKRDGYFRNRGSDPILFLKYRGVVLRDYYERTREKV